MQCRTLSYATMTLIRYLSSHLQCISVFTRKLKKLYFVSKPIIQNGHALSCCLQHRSARDKPPSSVYLVAVYPLPHHLVPGTRNRFDISLRCLQNRPYMRQRIPTHAGVRRSLIYILLWRGVSVCGYST